MLKRYLIGGALILSCTLMEAQNIMRIENKMFNVGAKVGFNATFPIINSLSINGQEAEEINMEYKIGYLASFFCRINIERFFLQPGISWSRSEGDIRFTIPQDMTNASSAGEELASSNRLGIQTNSIEMPIMVGFNWVKSGPYGLSVMVGPKLKYNYDNAYSLESSTTQIDYANENTPFGVNIAAGVGVNIGRLFFDFIYEFGLNQMESEFERIDNPLPETNYDITIDKRTNMMSISLGFLF